MRGWPAWLPGPLPLGVWLASRAVMVALLGTFHPWEWHPDLLYEWVLQMRAGGNPYQGIQAYPPLSMLAFHLPAALSPSAAAFRLVYALFIVALDLAVLVWMRRAERDGFRHAPLAYAIAMPAIGPILMLWRFDMLPVLCQIAATVCAARGSRAWSWAWLGVGIALKLYLLALVPLWIVWEVIARRRGSGGAGDLARGLMRGVVLALAPLVVFAGIAFLLWGPRSIDPYTYSFQRGVTIDSTPATIIAELSLAGVPMSWQYEPGCFCPVRSAGPAIDAPLKSLFSLTGIAGGLLFAAWYARSPGPWRLAAASAGITALAAFASPILSPQHLIWPLAPLALLAGDPRGRLSLGLAMVAAATAAYLMWGPGFQVHVMAYSDIGRALLVTRAFAELGAVVALVFPAGRSATSTRSTYSAQPELPA